MKAKIKVTLIALQWHFTKIAAMKCAAVKWLAKKARV